jgi:hypothetical protein
MDTQRRVRDRAFVWSTDILSHLSLAPGEIGLVGATKVLLNGMEWPVYLPLSASWSPSPTSVTSFEVTLISTVDLNGIRLWTAPFEADGLPGDRLKDPQRVEGLLPAYRPIRIRVPVPAKAGLYYLDAVGSVPAGSRVDDAPSTSFAAYFGPPRGSE